MPGELTPLSGGYPVRATRRAAREMTSYQAAAQVRIARMDADTDVALAAMDDLTTAVGWGMGKVVRIARLQQDLEALAPAATGRLAYLADVHGLGMGDVVDDLRRRLQR